MKIKEVPRLVEVLPKIIPEDEIEDFEPTDVFNTTVNTTLDTTLPKASECVEVDWEELEKVILFWYRKHCNTAKLKPLLKAIATADILKWKTAQKSKTLG